MANSALDMDMEVDDDDWGTAWTESAAEGVRDAASVVPDEKAAKAKAKAKAKEEGVVDCAKKKGGLFVIFCPGCRSWFKPDGIALGKRLCHGCKRCADNIRYACAAQKKLEWFQDTIMTNDAKLFQACQGYRERCPVGKVGEKRKQYRSKLVYTMVESVVVSSTVTRSTEGEMMTRKEYLLFAETVKGGRLREELALAQWATWDDESERTGWPAKDYEGPHKEMQLWVKTKQTIKFDDSVARVKSLTNTGPQMKGENLSVGDIEGMQKSLFLNHDNVAGGSNVSDLKTTVGQMFKAGAAGSAMGSCGMECAGNITDLVPDEDDPVPALTDDVPSASLVKGASVDDAGQNI